jgi:hypothetical protein
VEYEIFYTSSNDRALDFIDDFASTDKNLGEKVLMTPHFVLWSCPNCEAAFTDKHCLGGGRYCGMDIIEGKEKGESMNGRDILLEDIREKCLYNWAYNNTQTRELFWIYI